MKSIKVCEYSRSMSFHDNLYSEIRLQVSVLRTNGPLVSLPLTKVGMHFGHVKMCATPYDDSLTS